MIPQNKYKEYVNKRQVFKGYNCYAEYIKEVYVVYSHGNHFPIYAYIKDKWYGNKDKYSVTTSKHQSRARPNETVTYLTTYELINLIHDNTSN